MPRHFRVVSWNVNGIRAAARKGLAQWLDSQRADVIGLQEVRATPEQIPEPLRNPAGWYTHFVAAERKGYSGVGLYSRRQPASVATSIGRRAFDSEGRVQLARFGQLLIANVYFPNGNGTARDNSRVPFKLRFYRRLFGLLGSEVDRGAAVLVMGDFNTAHAEIDLARPKENQKTSGFLPQERKELSRWLDAGWVDTFRHLEPAGGHYTWWSQRQGARARNVGWRIDYVLASPAVVPHLKAATIHADVVGSDHCPISVTLDRAVLAAGA